MIWGWGRVEVDCLRLLLHDAVSTGLILSGRSTFAGLGGVKMGQIHSRGRGLRQAHKRMFCYCGGRKRPMAGMLPARLVKLQARPALHSPPLPSGSLL